MLSPAEFESAATPSQSRAEHRGVLRSRQPAAPPARELPAGGTARAGFLERVRQALRLRVLIMAIRLYFNNLKLYTWYPSVKTNFENL